MSTAQGIAREIGAFLDLAHRPVGIQIEEGRRLTTPAPRPNRFCILEQEDLSSGSRTFRLGDIECPGASLALGMVEPVYVDVEPRIHTGVRGIRLGPVEGANQVLFTVTARQAMALAVLTGGIEAHCTGTHAVCGEVIARVYETGRPHLSLLCQGMRDLCGFGDDQLVVGMSWGDFAALPRAMGRHRSLGVGGAQNSRDTAPGGRTSLVQSNASAAAPSRPAPARPTPPPDGQHWGSARLGRMTRS